MFLIRLTATAVCFCACAFPSYSQTGQPSVNHDPNKVKFVTSDIDNFWHAFDLAIKEPDKEKKTRIFQDQYLDKGSIGLHDFVRLRIKSASDLVETIEKLPRFYASVRAGTLQVADMEKEMRKSFRKFQQLHPDAVFSDVYFLIGVANTGGTASPNGLLIGAELFALTPNTPRDEFPNWFKTYLPDLKDAFPPAQTTSVASQFQGEWVPAKTACASRLKLVIESTTVIFVRGSDRAEYRKLEQCGACMGRDVENITLLSTDAMGDSPFMIYLDGSRKRPVVRVDFPNDEKLRKRFPFGAGDLKKCAAPTRAPGRS